jgi:hypothetical protein
MSKITVSRRNYRIYVSAPGPQGIQGPAGGGGSGVTGVFFVASLSDLRSIVSASTNIFAKLISEDGSAGGGFMWKPDPTAAAVDNPLLTVVPNDRAAASSGNKGYWLKIE